jgi:hypothetical protein
MIAGLVVYRGAEDGLSGFWIHADTKGVESRERIQSASLTNPVGDWPVDIMGPDGKPVFEGRISIQPLGESLRLIWTGSALPSGASATFEGIGTILPEGVLVATFEKKAATPAS